MQLVVDRAWGVHLPSYVDLEEACRSLFDGSIGVVELFASPVVSLAATRRADGGVALEVALDTHRANPTYVACTNPELGCDEVARAFRYFHDEDLEGLDRDYSWESNLRAEQGGSRGAGWVATIAFLLALQMARTCWSRAEQMAEPEAPERPSFLSEPRR